MQQSNMRINEEDPTQFADGIDESIEAEIYDPMDGTEEMTEREVREAALMNDFLGKQCVRK